jgi:thiamine-phosphate pyrophosphorylase
MQIIIYTPETPVENEIEIISEILDAGADYLYIRKPELDDFSLVDYVESIPERYWEKCISTSLIITKEFDLSGYHFRREIVQNNATYNNKVQEWLRSNHKISSVSAHSPDEIKVFAGGFDHILVSPVFESISKEDHRYEWNYEALENILFNLHSPHPTEMYDVPKTHFFAVGGVDVTKIPEIKAMHFDGFALLGALWKEPGNVMEKFKEIKRHCDLASP